MHGQARARGRSHTLTARNGYLGSETRGGRVASFSTAFSTTSSIVSSFATASSIFFRSSAACRNGPSGIARGRADRSDPRLVLSNPRLVSASPCSASVTAFSNSSTNFGCRLELGSQVLSFSSS